MPIYSQRKKKTDFSAIYIIAKSEVKIGVIGLMGIDAFYNTMAPFQTGLSITRSRETAHYWEYRIVIK